MPTRGTGTILIIDDEDSFRRIYLDMFQTAGYDVLVAENGEIGWNLAQAKKPDLIMLDLVLPGLQGFEVLKYIRSDAGTKDIPVIITTVLGAQVDVRKGLELGATDYMVKGFFSSREILIKIRSILAQANARKGVKSFKLSIKETIADPAELEVYMGLTKLFICPQCQEELLLDIVPDYSMTDSHWFLAHFICPKCQRSF